MKEKKKECSETIENVNTHGILSKKKIIIFSLIITTIILTTIILISIILLNRNHTVKIEEKLLAQKEAQLVELKIQLKEETEDKYKCLLIFTSNDEENKIKQIEYPKEEEKTPNIITTATEDGKQKIALDYEFNKEDINKTFKVKTKNGEIIPKRTCYIITYDPNDGINPPKQNTVLLGSDSIIAKQQPTKEGEVFWGWSEDKSADKPDYLKGSEFINSDNKEDITLYAIWENLIIFLSIDFRLLYIKYRAKAVARRHIGKGIATTVTSRATRIYIAEGPSTI